MNGILLVMYLIYLQYLILSYLLLECFVLYGSMYKSIGSCTARCWLSRLLRLHLPTITARTALTPSLYSVNLPIAKTARTAEFKGE